MSYAEFSNINNTPSGKIYQVLRHGSLFLEQPDGFLFYKFFYMFQKQQVQHVAKAHVVNPLIRAVIVSVILATAAAVFFFFKLEVCYV